MTSDEELYKAAIEIANGEAERESSFLYHVWHGGFVAGFVRGFRHLEYLLKKKDDSGGV